VAVVGFGPEAAIPALGGTVVIAKDFPFDLPPLPDPLAAWACQRIRVWGALNRRRQELLETYVDYLGEWVLTRPGTHSGATCVIRMPDEGTCTVVKKLLERWRVQHHHPIGVVSEDLPGALDFLTRTLHIPCHHCMSPADAKRVARIIARA
jgi:dTDP-4-amino-4,6-dideoxygalactose transaminase